MGKTTAVARLPMGSERDRRSTRPLGRTSGDPHASHRNVLVSWRMVKITAPPWYSVRTYS